MKKIILVAGVLAVVGSCKKKANDQLDKGPGEFYISFKTVDSTYNYKSGDKFTYVCGSVTVHHPSSPSSYHPNTYIAPLPLNIDMYSIKFQFTYKADCYECNPDMIKYGNKTFYVGPRNICKTDPMVSSKYCPDNDVVMIYWTDAAGKSLKSQAGDQPAGNYFYIDSVFDYRYSSANFNLLNYEKIIVGRFSGRVFDPENKTYSKDLTEGKFRMPIWRNY